MRENEESLLDDMLEDDSDYLSEWEISFLESLDERRDVPLSRKQSEIFQRISRKLNLTE